MTKSEIVAQGLRDAIARGEWSAGEQIPSEAQLCLRFSVSRLSVRSAINTLVTQGLLASYRGKGTFVREDSDDHAPTGLLTHQAQISMTDMFEFRRILETESAALTALRADAETRSKLQQLTKAFRDAPDPEAAVLADMDFHRTIAYATQNTVIAETFDLLQESYRRMFTQNVAIRGAAGAEEHLKIILAIESRSPDLARQYMAEHLNKSMAQTVKIHFSQTASKP